MIDAMMPCDANVRMLACLLGVRIRQTLMTNGPIDKYLLVAVEMDMVRPEMSTSKICHGSDSNRNYRIIFMICYLFESKTQFLRPNEARKYIAK